MSRSLLLIARILGRLHVGGIYTEGLRLPFWAEGHFRSSIKDACHHRSTNVWTVNPDILEDRANLLAQDRYLEITWQDP
ncbi:hypothetical protein AXF42_Ash008518 [Apostasia shenzhenica]|uniref:Uncharacterized protein n=1 Tax=Apostasia shenzhenica TaxID=1088818 RepID=A0A2I0AY48_9ASPA|nr:hypothetical protein AXF42_Ash008518 [Apostasia shenzhenica]